MLESWNRVSECRRAGGRAGRRADGRAGKRAGSSNRHATSAHSLEWAAAAGGGGSAAPCHVSAAVCMPEGVLRESRLYARPL
ncbi:hypothetical protein O3P69_018522 [Scylla paramamosain]|uniref:Uncharacterized protein n=1 Tax=Scylla paramamosain TaxID=85552 RepID=A0AAW0T3F7_SCYPA